MKSKCLKRLMWTRWPRRRFLVCRKEPGHDGQHSNGVYSWGQP